MLVRYTGILHFTASIIAVIYILRCF